MQTEQVEKEAEVDADSTTVDNPTSNSGDRAKEPRNRKPRGKRVLYIGLRESDEALRKIDQHAKHMSKVGFARALGHGEAQGRFGLKVDALKQFGLIEEEDDDLRLSPLAVDMLYGASDSARNKARVAAFLNCDEFKRTFVECPKNQDHPLTYIRDFAMGKLGVINEVDRFIRLFLESAHFAGLLDGQPESTTDMIRLRQGPPESSGKPTPATSGRSQTEVDTFHPLPFEQLDAVLDDLGLLEFKDRSAVLQSELFRVKLTADSGSINIEFASPMRVSISTSDVLGDLATIVARLKEKGHQA